MKKMTAKHWKSLAAATLAILMVASVAAAFSPDNSRKGRDFGRKGGQRSMLGIWQNPQAISQLGLSEEQVSQLKEADFASREKRLEISARMDRLRLDMQRARAADPIDADAIRKVAKQIADDMGAMFLHRTEAQLTATEILTPDQINKAKEYRMQRINRQRDNRQRRAARGGQEPGRGFTGNVPDSDTAQ